MAAKGDYSTDVGAAGRPALTASANDRAGAAANRMDVKNVTNA